MKRQCKPHSHRKTTTLHCWHGAVKAFALAVARNAGCQQAERGISLIELLIAITLSVAMLTTILQTLNTTYINRGALVAKNQIQFNCDHALKTLTRTLRYNSFEGCKPPGMAAIDSEFGQTPQGVSSTLAGEPSAAFPIDDTGGQALLGFDIDGDGNPQPTPPNTEVGDLIENLSPPSRPNSSIILSYNASPEMITTNAAMGDASADISIPSNDIGLEADDYALITDCFNATVFQVSNDPETAIAHDGLPDPYGSDAQVHRVEYNVFYVGDTNRRDVADNPIYALFMSQNGTVQELAEGVNLMKVEYQIPQTDQRQYVAATNSTLNISEVRTLQISLLVSSVATPLSDPDAKSYHLLSETIGPQDLGGELASRNIKQVFTAAIRLRNRG